MLVALIERIPDKAKGTRERPKIGPKEPAESPKRNPKKPRREQGSPKPFNLLSPEYEAIQIP